MIDEIIYQGRMKKLGAFQQVRIIYRVSAKTGKPSYFVVFGDKSKYALKLNLNTEAWEEIKIGVTPLSKKAGKIIEDYFS